MNLRTTLNKMYNLSMQDNNFAGLRESEKLSYYCNAAVS